MKATAQNVKPDITKIVERNVNALVNRKKEDLKKRSFNQKFVSNITSFAGSMASLYIHSILFGVWVIWNLGFLPLKPFDPSFIMLATFAAVEAIFLTTFVLIGQKDMNVQAENGQNWICKLVYLQSMRLQGY